MPVHDLRARMAQLEQLLLADPDNISVRQELLRHQSRYLAEAEADPTVARSYRDNLELLYALSPRDPLVSDLLARGCDPAYQPIPPTDREAAELWRAGLATLEAGRLDDALGHLRAALLAAPDDPAVHAGLARLELHRQLPDAALVHAEFAVRRRPESARLTALHGEALAAVGRHREAFEKLLAALVLNPLCGDAEQQLVALGFRLGYRWVKLPLRPGVWPLIAADGRHWLVPTKGLSRPATIAWDGWAQAVVRLCGELPPGDAPLAGLPRRMPPLIAAHRQLLDRWRGCRWQRYLRWRSAPTPAELLLDWLREVDRAGLLEAYLFYSYLHPELMDDYQRWCAAAPGAMERFLREHVVHWEAAPRRGYDDL